MNKLLNGLLFTAWLVPVSYQVLAAPKAPPLSSKPEATRASKNAETRTVRLRIQGMRSKSCPVL